MILISLIIILLYFLLIFMIIKLYLMKKSIKEITSSLNEILNSDTNNVITISSNNKQLKKLASNINKELKTLRNQRTQYENGNQELKDTITNISHDMRTPLTAIMGYIDLIKDDKEKDKEKEYIEIIERKANDLKKLTDNLFDFSKAIDIGDKINKEKCCINEILEESLAEFYSVFKSKHVIPKINICSEKVYRYLDKNTIKRIFENILSNVCKYASGDFKVELDNEGKIIFSNKAIDLDIVTVEKLFDRYYTVENARKSAGIGLSIAKQLVELNNGKISAKYKKGYLNIIIEFEK